MHRIFQAFVDGLAESTDAIGLESCMADAAASLDLTCFAYLAMPSRSDRQPLILSTYPREWTAHYLRSGYEQFDPVIVGALKSPEPFRWGLDMMSAKLSLAQQKLFEEAGTFGIHAGFTIPIHDGRGPIAAVTFASDDTRADAFRFQVERQVRVLQLMAIYFHAHVRRTLTSERVVGGILLSPREFECLEWAARGKSAWEIGQILGISRRTAAFHLDNAKARLAVRSICQAVSIFSGSRREVR